MCGLTFELSGRQRQDASARTVKMYRVPPAGRWWPAVGAPLERRVRPRAAVADALRPASLGFEPETEPKTWEVLMLRVRRDLAGLNH